MITAETGARSTRSGSCASSVSTRKSGSLPSSLSFSRGPCSSSASPNLSGRSRRCSRSVSPSRVMASTLRPYFSRKCSFTSVLPAMPARGASTASAIATRSDSSPSRSVSNGSPILRFLRPDSARISSSLPLTSRESPARILVSAGGISRVASPRTMPMTPRPKS